LTLLNWYKSQKKRLDIVLESQVKFVANNAGKGVKVTDLPKYKQAEEILIKLGFYGDDLGSTDNK
jgi:hypothetical protein